MGVGERRREEVKVEVELTKVEWSKNLEVVHIKRLIRSVRRRKCGKAKTHEL